MITRHHLSLDGTWSFAPDPRNAGQSERWYSTQGFDVYLATGLTAGEPDREPGEQDMVHRRFTDEEVDQAIRTGLMVDAPSLAALTLYRLAVTRADDRADRADAE